METTKPEIYGALARIIAAVGVVGKTRKNVAQGYQFRGIDDVLSACQSVLAEHGVVCVPRVVEREREVVATKNGGFMASVRLLIDHTFYARDGSFVVCTTLGEAMDSGDKASNKAMSAALKYALVETLCIPTFEDDRDTETASPEMAGTAKPRAAPAKPAAPTQGAGGLEAAKTAARAAFVGAKTQPELEAAWNSRAKWMPKAARDELAAPYVAQQQAIRAHR